MTCIARRVVYGLLAALGFAMMVPFGVRARVWRAELRSAGLDLEAALGAGDLAGPALLGAVGLLVATLFLYAALTVCHPRVSRPEENGQNRCRRCGADLRFGVRRCPDCDQQLVW